MSMPVTLRKMVPGDVSGAILLSRAAGWNQTEKDWLFLINSPGHLSMVAEVHHDVVGTITAVLYEKELAWIGMVLVAKDNRGQGISKRLLANVLDQLSHVKVIKLDATPQGQLVYKGFGFLETNSIIRMTKDADRMYDLASEDSSNIAGIDTNMQPIVDLDYSVFGARRTQLIEYLVGESPNRCWSFSDHSGFILGRAGDRYHHLGPMVAKDEADAKILIAKVLRDLNGKSVVVDVPEDKSTWLIWLTSIGFSPQRNFVRMSKNQTVLNGLVDKQYLIAGPEFG